MSEESTEHTDLPELPEQSISAEPLEQAERPEPVVPAKRKRRRLHFWNAFKNFAIIFSFIVNFILILVLLLSPAPLFTVKGQFAQPLLDDLDGAFAALGETTIRTQVDIQDTMPVVFDLPLNQNTDVILTAPVPLQVPATFFLPAGGGSINGTVSLNLPQGMRLPVSLSMMVPVSTSVPVVMEVPVAIKLDESGMGPAIEQLRAVFKPLGSALQKLPDSPQEIFNP